MNTFSQTLNHPADAFRRQTPSARWAAWLPVLLTILVNTVFDPIYSHFQSDFHPAVHITAILKTTVCGLAGYIAICAVLWIVCKCFGSKTTFAAHFAAWGATFYPNLLCSFAVVFSEVYFTIFWNNSLWGMLLGIVFVGVLLWKVVLTVIYLKEVANLSRGRLIGAFLIIGLFIAALAALNGYLGLKTPIL